MAKGGIIFVIRNDDDDDDDDSIKQCCVVLLRAWMEKHTKKAPLKLQRTMA